MKFGSKDLREYRQDEEAESGRGIEIKQGDMRFFCRRMGGTNVAYKRALGRYSTGIAKTRARTGEIDIVGSEKATNLAFLETCLIGWAGIVDENGAEVPYSRNTAEELFKQYPELLDAITDEAALASNYRAQEIEEAAAALGNSSVGP